jgi:hypothetical protein
MRRQANIDAIRNFAALGAGVLLALTPHCAGKSESRSDASNDSGGSGSELGGASGTAGVYDGPGMYGGGGYGGVGTGGSSGSNTGGFGACCTMTQRVCYTPAELVNCVPWDAGLDAQVDGGVGEGGAGGEASDPMPIMRPVPPSDAGANPDPNPDAGGGALPPMPPTYSCPYEPPFPGCAMGQFPPPSYVFSLDGWNGTQCCYSFLVTLY